MRNTGTLSFVSIVFAIVFSACLAQAEYRAFSLVITNQTTGTQRKVVSTLDDRQYAEYHHLQKTDAIAIEKSWMCYRRSEFFTSICTDPGRPETQDRSPAAELPTATP